MANIVLRLSGGTNNTVANDSLGGAMSSEASATINVTDREYNNLFDDISKSENQASPPESEYRCVYIYNDAQPGATFSNGEVFLREGATKADIAIASDREFIEGRITTQILDEKDAPLGVVFDQEYTSSNPLRIGTIVGGAGFPIWIKRTPTSQAGTTTLTDEIKLVVRGIE